MSSSKALRITSIFVAAFLFGLAWVGVFRFFHGYLAADNSQAIAPVAERQISEAPAEPLLSMDDPSFTPPQVDETNPEAFDPEGVYTVDGDLSPAFREFELFTINNKKLDVECDAKDFGSLIAPTGSVIETAAGSTASAGRSLKFQRIEIANTKIYFATEAVNGSRYEFEGNYLVNGNFYTLDPDAKVLRGTLSKFQDGRKVAETEVSFTWSIDLTCVC